MDVLELDFQFWRFWAFSLLAISITLLIAWYNINFQNNPWESKVGLMAVSFTALWVISLGFFLVTYVKFKKKLSKNLI
ncbi:MAG: hypothetical protein ISS48_04070 [Candidatus Aenigmarchaeota archaeon]|nr:hypothetical protein [Candidatus Aenigmarchaeota archaeon]